VVVPHTKVNPQVLGNIKPFVGGNPVGSIHKDISFNGDLARESKRRGLEINSQ